VESCAAKFFLFKLVKMVKAALIVYAKHSFQAVQIQLTKEGPDEVSFCFGEKINVYEKDEKFQDGWWTVR
jgi:hypothetical protein